MGLRAEGVVEDRGKPRVINDLTFCGGVVDELGRTTPGIMERTATKKTWDRS